MDKTVQSDSGNSFHASEEITDPSRIALLLGQLSKHYSPLTVQIHGHKEQYASCIINVDKPYVLLDELMPSTGHEQLVNEGKIHAVGRLSGVDIGFTATLKRVDEQKNMLTYYMNLPTKLDYRQRRQTYRIRIPMSQQLRVLIDDGGKTSIEGILHDLSHGGAGKIVPEGRFEIKQGQLYECAIELPCGDWLYSTVEMRYLKSTRARKRQLIGVRFESLTPLQSRIIGRCISELELEEIRKRTAFK